MKKLILLLICFTTLFLSACSSGVAQEDYDAIVNERDKLQGQLSKVNEKLSNLKLEQANKDMELSYVKAWAETNFGENGIFFVDNPDYLQCIVGFEYIKDKSGISAIWKNLTMASSLLGEFKEEINYKKIGIKYLDGNGNLIVEFILKRNGNTYELETISVDATLSDLVVSTLTGLTN